LVIKNKKKKKGTCYHIIQNQKEKYFGHQKIKKGKWTINSHHKIEKE
jgi:hypothetical protein